MPPKPRKLQRGEWLDRYPATFPHDQPPPLTSEVIADNAQDGATHSTRVSSAEDPQVVAESTSESSTYAPPASTSHFPPTYFFGWLYEEDDFYGRFANKDDEDAWDIYEGWKEMMTRPFRARYPGMSVPDFDIEAESKECIVNIAYNLEERSRVKAQDQALIDAAKDILEEAREPMWYRRV